MIVTAGIDAGHQTTKVVLLSQDRMVCHVVIPCGREAAKVVAKRALIQAVKKGRLSPTDIKYIIATGIAREDVSIATEGIWDSFCVAKGIEWILPSIRTVLDIGAQRSLAVKCAGGVPISVAGNEKCAAGSGLYLEMVAKIMDIGIQEMGELSMQSKEPVEIESICAIFAESEIISLIHMKKKAEDILNGVFSGLARRIYPLLAGVSFEKEMAMVGGVAKNGGMVKALREQLMCDIIVPEIPEVVSALGAAIIARERYGA